MKEPQEGWYKQHPRLTGKPRIHRKEPSNCRESENKGRPENWMQNQMYSPNPAQVVWQSKEGLEQNTMHQNCWLITKLCSQVVTPRKPR